MIRTRFDRLIGISGSGHSFVALLLLTLAGCHSSSSSRNQTPPPPPPPADIGVSGIVSDGPVIGGQIFGFAAADVIAALDAASMAVDRGAALAAASPVVTLMRSSADEDTFEVDVDAGLANEALFLVFDNNGSEDEQFGDTPPNLESVAILGAAGTSQVINLSLHTTLIAQIVRGQLDPDGDGAPIDAGAIASAIQAIELDVLDAVGHDDHGDDLFDGERPVETEDEDTLHAASSALGLDLRAAADLNDLDIEDAIAGLAADIGDGAFDGIVPPGLSAEIESAANALREFKSRGLDDDLDVFGVGACSSSAVTLRRACAVNLIDDRFEGRAFCADISDDDERADCLAELNAELQESVIECGDVFEARLAVCAALNDAPHEPAFGMDFTQNFVDPREIGTTVDPNPYLPLVPGSTWVYEGEFFDEDEGELIMETVTVTVLDRIKLIDGIPCIVVNDVVASDAGAKEDTNDWLAQDMAGNVWYCGEISRDFELFDGDDPEEFELVHTEGSWKHGRDGAKAGILLPAMPELGATIRQEVLFGEAEDMITIESLTGTESAPGGSCDGDCLVTLDFTPLDPGVEENKYYAPGIGMIVEVDLETGDRLELIEFSQP